MPQQRKASKAKLSLWVNKDLLLKSKRLAQTRGISLSELITEWLAKETKDTELTPEDCQELLAFLNRPKA